MRKKLFLIYKGMVKIFSGHVIGKFYPLRIADNFLISHLKPTFVEVQGHKMFLDSKDSLSLLNHEVYEPFETEVVKKKLKEVMLS